MKDIVLKCGAVARVDDDYFDLLSQFRWYLSPQGYAMRTMSIGGKKKTLLMHREVLRLMETVTCFVDHIDGDTLNNQRQNLRQSSPAQNQCNRGAQKNNTSGYKGVTLDKRRGRFAAKININRRRVWLGYFDTAEAAHAAYCSAAMRLHGEFANHGTEAA
jgi:hypothetical protein